MSKYRNVSKGVILLFGRSYAPGREVALEPRLVNHPAVRRLVAQGSLQAPKDGATGSKTVGGGGTPNPSPPAESPDAKDSASGEASGKQADEQAESNADPAGSSAESSDAPEGKADEVATPDSPAEKAEPEKSSKESKKKSKKSKKSKR